MVIFAENSFIVADSNVTILQFNGPYFQYQISYKGAFCVSKSFFQFRTIYLLTVYPVRTEKYQARNHIVRTERSEVRLT